MDDYIQVVTAIMTCVHHREMEIIGNGNFLINVYGVRLGYYQIESKVNIRYIQD